MEEMNPMLLKRDLVTRLLYNTTILYSIFEDQFEIKSRIIKIDLIAQV